MQLHINLPCSFFVYKLFYSNLFTSLIHSARESPNESATCGGRPTAKGRGRGHGRGRGRERGLGSWFGL
jgi:hypothetical protein